MILLAEILNPGVKSSSFRKNRIHGRTRPLCTGLKTTLAKREPSTHAPERTFGGAMTYVRFAPYSVAKLCLLKNDAILIRRHTHLGKNESFPP
jgi:hypothetical protein